ncbi:tubulin-like doman-containing protein [Halorubrum tibetense]|uniref:Tubulin-like doman-containing protein n=1 Tax=Halorubrum tibetense TaxID=175631 RepID=A0ABD5S6U6_9EURY
MNLPSRIFAVGGAGKAITYELLKADWVQEAVLRPRPNPESLTVTVIDTAEEEENRDLERIQEIERQIQETKDRLRDQHTGRPGEITIEYLPLTRNIQLHDQNDLIGQAAVPRIAAGVGMDEENWWLQPEFINENLDFATGVVRKRGLGKGLYYKAYAEDDDVRTAIDLPGRGKVAVIAGLGGGSGSGIFIDLVRHLKRTQRTAEITLFGVLPNDDEGEAETANAHAALSELEHLSLQGEDLFKDRILIPIDPTGFGGKKANILQSSDALIEFDRAAIYLIATYYNMMDMEDPFADTPSYAPFIIGIPQVLRYNVDAIQDAKSVTKDILNAKQDALEAEADIYAGVDRFLSREWSPDGMNGELHDSDRTDLETRLNNVKSLLDLDLFTELDYESVSIYREIVSEAEAEADDIVERIEVIGGSIRAGTAEVSTDGEQFVDSIDKQLGDVIRDELSRLAHRKDLLVRLRAVDDNRVESTISYLLALEDEAINAGVRLNQLEAKLDEATDRRDRLQSDLEDAEAELEEQRRAQQDEVDRRVDDWERAVRTLYDEYDDCRSIDVDNMVDSLEMALETFAREVENAETEDQLEAIDDSGVRGALSTLSEEFDRVGININDVERRINASLADLTDAKKSFLRMNEEEGTLESILPWDTSDEEERKQAQKNYRMKRNQLDDNEVFAISRAGSSLSVEPEFSAANLARTIEDEAEDRRRDILAETRAELDEEHSRDIDELGRELESGASFTDLARAFEEMVKDEAVETDDIERRRDDLEADLEEAEHKAELYSGTVDLFEELNGPRDMFISSQDTYRDLRENYNESRETTVSTESEDYHYVKTVKPHDILQLRDDADIAGSKLFDDETERQRLRGSLEELAKNAHNPKYTGIRKRRISGDRARYNDMNIVVGVMSRAINQIGDVADLKPVFQGAYNLGAGSENYASFPVEAGGSWDIGLGIFIDGIFLDNLRAEVEADGYHTGYQAREAADDTDILVHHTYGLDEGHYVRRNEILNLENPRDIEFFLRDEGEIREDLLEEYSEVVHFTDDSTDAEAAESVPDEEE